MFLVILCAGRTAGYCKQATGNTPEYNRLIKNQFVLSITNGTNSLISLVGRCSLANSIQWTPRYCIYTFRATLSFQQWISLISIFCELTIRWGPQHLTNHQSTLIQVMAWCRQATSHYLSQCWPRSMSPYDVTRPQWVKISLSTYDVIIKMVTAYSIDLF